MKKIVSALLVLAVSMSVMFFDGNIIANATGDQDSGVIVTPITEYTSKRTMLEGSPQYPLDNVVLKGETVNRTLPWNVEPDKLAITSTCTLQFDSMSEALSGTTGLIFFVSVPNANTLNPTFIFEKLSNSRYYGYPEVSLKVGETYQKMELDSDTWENGKIIDCYNDNQPNTNKIKGGIQFNGAFTGYVKIPYSSMTSVGIKYINPSEDIINNITFRISDVGGDYGRVTVGPLFLINNDSNIANIIIPQKYIKAPETKINAVTSFVSQKIGLSAEHQMFCYESGIIAEKLSSSDYWCNDDTNVGGQNQKVLWIRNMSESIEDISGIVMYLDIPNANLISLYFSIVIPEDKSRWNKTFQPEFSLYVGRNYYTLQSGNDEWSEETVVACDKNNFKGGMRFTGAFSGYVYLPFTSFKNDSGLSLIKDSDKLGSISVRMKEIGGEYGDITIMPAMLMSEGAINSNIKIAQRKPVTVESNIQNGVVSVDKPYAAPGEKIEVTVQPSSGYALLPGSLKAKFSDFGVDETDTVSEWSANKSSYVYTVKDNESGITVDAEFLPDNTDYLGILNFEKQQDNSFKIKMRYYSPNEERINTVGVLITRKKDLGDKELDHNAVGVNILDVVCDPESIVRIDGKYFDYDVLLSDIDVYNFSREFIVRGYVETADLNGTLYRYTEKESISLDGLNTDNAAEFQPFSEITKIESNRTSVVQGDAQKYPYFQPINISCTEICDRTQNTVQNSPFSASVSYSSMPLKDFSDIVFYVKVPLSKENFMYLRFIGSNGYEYKTNAGYDYALLAYGTKKWEWNKTAEGTNCNYGSIRLPAGFEGYVRLPLTSLYEVSRVTSSTKIDKIIYRFGYIGSGDDSVSVGGVFGMTDRLDFKREQMIDTLSSATTEKSVLTDKIEVSADSCMLYWEEYPEAENYLVTAYKAMKDGYLKKAYNVLFSNSGSLIGLEPGEYIVNVTARDSKDNVLGVYSNVIVNIPENDDLSEPVDDGQINYDYSDSLSPQIDRKYTALPAGSSYLLNSNPNRGLRGYMDFYDYSMDKTELLKRLENFTARYKRYLKNYEIKTYVCYFYIGAYLEKDLDQDFYNTAQIVFDYCRENRIQLLLRFAYYDVNFYNKRTATTEEMMGHINQLASNGLITRNKDVIHSFQAGFAGQFGEWHSENTPTDKSQLMSGIVNDLIPAEMYLQVRMPNYKDYIPDSNPLKKKIGFHIDSFFGIMDGTELGSGTYSYGLEQWNRQKEYGYDTPNDAEVYYYSNYLNMGVYSEGYGSAIGAFQLHLTTLSGFNGYLDQGILPSGCMTYWQKLPITEQWLRYNGMSFGSNWFKDTSGRTVKRNVFEYIRDHLGYRISVEELHTEISGSDLKVNLSLINNGFSAAFNIASELVILDEQDSEVASAAFGDPSEWYTGKEMLLNGSIRLPEINGNYRLAIKLSSPSGDSARLDNNLPFDGGYNILHSFKIGS